MEMVMYLIRRIYKTKPGQARKVASLVHKQATIYHKRGIDRNLGFHLTDILCLVRTTRFFWNGYPIKLNRL